MPYENIKIENKRPPFPILLNCSALNVVNADFMTLEATENLDAFLHVDSQISLEVLFNRRTLRFGLPYLACGQQEHSVPFLFIGFGSSMRQFRKLFPDGNQVFWMVLWLPFMFEVDFDVPVYLT